MRKRPCSPWSSGRQTQTVGGVLVVSPNLLPADVPVCRTSAGELTCRRLNLVALLAYVGSNRGGSADYMAVFLTGGQLALEFDLGGGSVGVTTKTFGGYSDDAWHRVRVVRSGGQARLSVDTGLTLNTVSGPLGSRANLRPGQTHAVVVYHDHCHRLLTPLSRRSPLPPSVAAACAQPFTPGSRATTLGSNGMLYVGAAPGSLLVETRFTGPDRLGASASSRRGCVRSVALGGLQMDPLGAATAASAGVALCQPCSGGQR